MGLRKTDIQIQFEQLCERRYAACYRDPGPKKSQHATSRKAKQNP